MTSMKPLFALLATLVLLGSSCSAYASEWQPSPGHKQEPIWPGTPPDALPTTGPETVQTCTDHLVAGKPWIYSGPVSRPTITVYSPPAGKNTGAAVLVFPGGGYQILAMDLEGTEICDWLTSRGITAVLLKYRVPGEGKLPKSGHYPKSKLALEDAQRALSLVRYRAKDLQIDPHKIGVIGFSAGGHLVAATSTQFGNRLYKPVDAADKVSCRPDFGIAIYPGHLWVEQDKFELMPQVPVTKQTPPQFLLQNEDDRVDPPEHSLVYYRALKKAGVPVEMHLYPKGGHAFGLRQTKLPVTQHWPKLVETWLAWLKVIPE